MFRCCDRIIVVSTAHSHSSADPEHSPAAAVTQALGWGGGGWGVEVKQAGSLWRINEPVAANAASLNSGSVKVSLQLTALFHQHMQMEAQSLPELCFLSADSHSSQLKDGKKKKPPPEKDGRPEAQEQQLPDRRLCVFRAELLLLTGSHGASDPQRHQPEAARLSQQNKHVGTMASHQIRILDNFRFGLPAKIRKS